MKKLNKKTIYIILAVLCILAGLYIERQERAAENTPGIGSAESASNAIAKAENLTDKSETQETIISETYEDDPDYVQYYFRNDKLLEQHYEKHGMEMGFESMEAYEEAACAVIYHPEVLTKTEEEDGDYVYYIEESNEFVVVSKDGYIRTYFYPDAGIDYYNRQ